MFMAFFREQRRKPMQNHRLGCMSAQGLSELHSVPKVHTVTAANYIYELLTKSLLPALNCSATAGTVLETKMEPGRSRSILIQDNATPLTSNCKQDCGWLQSRDPPCHRGFGECDMVIRMAVTNEFTDTRGFGRTLTKELIRPKTLIIIITMAGYMYRNSGKRALGHETSLITGGRGSARLSL